VYKNFDAQANNKQRMAPPNTQKRVKGVQIYRPFIFGSTAKLFGEDNPKPPGTPVDHTHSWTVFVKGVDDLDITYWCKKVQFKLHESIPNHMRSMLHKIHGFGEDVANQTFQ
jgi:YEATS domain-containing protein 4